MKKSAVSDLILQCSCVANSNDSDISAANSTKLRLLTCWGNSNNYFFPPMKGGSKLHLELSFEIKSYIWTLFFSFHVVSCIWTLFFSFHVVSLFLSDSNLWIKPWQVHTYGLFIICLCMACFFFCPSMKVLFISHSQIFCCCFHMVKSFVKSIT